MEVESVSDEEIEEVREGFALISLSKETNQCIRAPYFRALIVKVFRRTIGFTFLNLKIMLGKIDMVDLGRDFFLVRFLVLEDLEMGLRKGPWFIGEHILSIQKWEANFKPSEVQVSLVAVWVCLNELPIEYYDAVVLRQIDQALRVVL